MISSGIWVHFLPDGGGKGYSLDILIPNPVDFEATGHSLPLTGLVRTASVSDMMSW